MKKPKYGLLKVGEVITKKHFINLIYSGITSVSKPDYKFWIGEKVTAEHQKASPFVALIRRPIRPSRARSGKSSMCLAQIAYGKLLIHVKKYRNDALTPWDSLPTEWQTGYKNLVRDVLRDGRKAK